MYAIRSYYDGTREGWYTLEDIEKESTVAEAVATKADDTRNNFV